MVGGEGCVEVGGGAEEGGVRVEGEGEEEGGEGGGDV